MEWEGGGMFVSVCIYIKLFFSHEVSAIQFCPTWHNHCSRAGQVVTVTSCTNAISLGPWYCGLLYQSLMKHENAAFMEQKLEAETKAVAEEPVSMFSQKIPHRLPWD
jgi:hypothetical protein